jgi:hypothetical protein
VATGRESARYGKPLDFRFSPDLNFHDLHAVRPNAVTEEALLRIGALYRIEEQIRGKPADERRRVR